jgi:DEAD/DEAH box helicase domain-containing protein
MDSLLEARFVEALKRFARADLPVTVRKSLVRNKPGFLLSVGLDPQEWLIEPQVTLGSAQGLAVEVSIDFVLRPATVASGRKPIAVFLDGFQYHRDRVGHDMLQRMSLLTSGTYDVWGFTWQDVDAAFDRTTALPPMHLHPDGEVLKTWYRRLGHGAWAHVIDTTPMELLLKSLASEKDPIPWEPLAAIALIAQMAPPPHADTVAWRQDILAMVPAPLQSSLDAEDRALFARRPVGEPGTLALWATTTLAAAKNIALIDDFRAVVWLDDSPELRGTTEYQTAWRAFLFVFLFLRKLPQVLFLTRTGSRSTEGYARLAQLRAVRSRGLAEGWTVLDVSPGFEAVIEHLALADAPLPEVGLDLPDARGLSSGIEGELVWETQRVAVVRDLTEAEASRVAPGWKVFVLATCTADATPLVNALRGATQGETS